MKTYELSDTEFKIIALKNLSKLQGLDTELSIKLENNK